MLPPSAEMLTEFVKRAMSANSLTARELDLVLAMLRGHATTRELADELGISESTVSNHIDNISSKTGLGGKSEILAYLVQKLCRFVENARFFIRAPHVLVLDDQVDMADMLAQHFRERGCQAMAAYAASDDLIETIVSHRIDLIVCDVMLGDKNGLEFLERVRSRLKYLPASIVISAASNVTESDAFDAGAVAWMRKPLDPGRLFELSVNAFIHADKHAGRKERMPLQTNVKLASGGAYKTSEIGLAGMSIETQDPSGLPVGAPVRFALELPGKRAMEGLGIAVWSSPASASQPNSAVGIKFEKLREQDEAYLKDLVRTRNILSFLPFNEPLGGDPETPTPKGRRGG